MNSRNIQDEINEYSQNSYDFTNNARKLFNDTINLDDFFDKDSDYIYESLHKNLRPIPFGDFLKRYLYKIAKLEGDYLSIDTKVYQDIIVDCFRENHTPASFAKTTSKISALAKNWLNQASIKRQFIFLLGFGLDMSLKDISEEFLLKAQGEHDFNFKDPTEIIYWYCFKNKYKFSKMLELKEAYENLPVNKNTDIYDEKTNIIKNKFQSVGGDDQHFLNYLADFKTDNQNNYSVTAYKWFEELYLKCRKIIANIYNRQEEKKLEREIKSYMDKNKGSWTLTAADKDEHVVEMRKTLKKFTADDITDGDFEKFLYKGTSIEEVGKLPRFSDSTLSEHFIGKILSRQHLWEIRDKNISVDRFDLITLNFFIFSRDSEYTSSQDNKRRYDDFKDSTNKMLNECSMGELYDANTYECFLLMCIISDYPAAAYKEVLGQAFESVHRAE